MYDKKFDPLNAKYTGNEAVVILSIQREINNILNSWQKNIIVRELPWKRQLAGFMFRKSI